MKNSLIAAGVALAASIGSVSTSQALNMVVDQYLTASVNYTLADFATSFNLGTTSLSVSTFADGLASDRSGLALGDLVNISNGNIPYTLGTQLTLSWTGSNGPFTETLTLVTIDSDSAFGPYYTGAQLVFDGTLTGGGYNNILAGLVIGVEFYRNGGGLVPGGLFAYNAAIAQSGPQNVGVGAVPESSTWVMMLAGFAGLGFLGYRRNKAAILAA